MARIFHAGARLRRPLLPMQEIAPPRRIFGKRRARHAGADGLDPGPRPRRAGGAFARLRQRLRWFQYRNPVRATLTALLLPVLVLGGWAAWRADLAASLAATLAAHPRLAELLDVTLDPLGAVPDSAAGLVQATLGPLAGVAQTRWGDCRLMPWGNCVVDGDTIRVDGARVRLAAIDTPEIFAPACAAELALGRRAAARLRRLLSEGAVDLQPSGFRDRDRYGRLLRSVTVDGASPAYTLIREGLARRWDGARRGWC